MTDLNPDGSINYGASDSMLALTTKIVAAYIRKNAMPGDELPALIDRVFQSLAGLATGSAAAPEAAPMQAVPVKKSVFADYIVYLGDGKKMKMLKRHLMTSYGLTPDAYRQRLGSPSSYPMVAPDDAEKHSILAKSMSVFADYIVCLEDGKKMKTLKRHLMTSYGLTPDAYRQRWGLPSSYPMVAPDYAKKRSALAKSMGLGRTPGIYVVAAESEPQAEPEKQHVTPIPKTGGRKVAKAAKAHEG